MSEGTTRDPLRPTLPLLMKLGSIVVHAEEMLSPKGHHFDKETILSLLSDKQVQDWIKDMDVYMPVKR